MRRFLLTLPLVAIATGCIPGLASKPPAPPGGAFNVTGADSKNLSSVNSLASGAESSATADPASGITLGGIQVEVYAVSVPRNAISANEEFWKRVDEDSLIDHARYEALFANGFRVGIAKSNQWDYFKKALEKNPATYQRNAMTVNEEQSVEVPVRSNIDEQQLSFFAPGAPLELKTYTDSENILGLSFIPAPHRADACRVAMTPVVRSTRERTIYTPNNEEQKSRIKAVERLYDLNFTAEVPFGSFLVLSPSTDTARPSSIGRNFLLIDDTAEQHELVLLVVPTRVILKPTEAKADEVKSDALKKKDEDKGSK